MFPYIIESIGLQTYTVLLIIGLFGAVLLFKYICAREHIADSVYNFYSILALVSIVVGLLSAILFQGIYDWMKEGGAFKITGMTFMGGLIGGVLTFLLGTFFFAKRKQKQNFWRIANIASLSVVLGHFFGRLGCFMAGCCYGKETDGIFGMKFPDLSHKVYPTQLYEAIFLGLLFAALMLLMFKFKRPNILMLVYLYSYAIFRFFIEFIRGDNRGAFLFGVLSPSQVQSIIMLLVAVALTVCIYGFKKIPFAVKKEYSSDDDIQPILDEAQIDLQQETLNKIEEIQSKSEETKIPIEKSENNETNK